MMELLRKKIRTAGEEKVKFRKEKKNYHPSLVEEEDEFGG